LREDKQAKIRGGCGVYVVWLVADVFHFLGNNCSVAMTDAEPIDVNRPVNGQTSD
jgi:hypothetical protein